MPVVSPVAKKAEVSPEEAEKAFLNALEDLVPIAEALAEHCSSVEELVEMCKLALGNVGQLKLLMSLFPTK